MEAVPGARERVRGLLVQEVVTGIGGVLGGKRSRSTEVEDACPMAVSLQL